MARRSKSKAAKARTERRKKLTQWSLDVRHRDDMKCVVCGAVNYLNAHHVVPKETYPQFQYMLDNGVTLCPRHHKFGAESAHKNGVWFSLWLQNHHPQLYAVAVDRVAVEKICG